MTAWIFADVERLHALGRNVQRFGSSPGFLYFVVSVCSIAAIWLALQWAERHRFGQGQKAQTLQALFLELCQAHRLNRTERKLLQNAADNLPPDEQCGLFIDPRILGRLSISDSPDIDGYAKLAVKMFGDCGT